MKRAPDSESVVALLSLLLARDGAEQRRARRKLKAAPEEAVVPALIAALRRADDSRAFDRTAKLLAEIGGEEAMEALTQQARTQRRFPRLAIRALGMCRHPQTVPVLLDLLQFGRIKQRRAAAFALARIGTARAIEPLCQAVSKSPRDIGPEALTALRSMGRADVLARRVLAEQSLSVMEQVRIIGLLWTVHPSLVSGWLIPGDPQRFLDREAARWRSPLQQAAREAAALLRQQRMLLRPSERRDDTTLLRAVGGPDSTDGDTLLRAAALPDGEGTGPKREATGRWSRLLRRFTAGPRGWWERRRRS